MSDTFVLARLLYLTFNPNVYQLKTYRLIKSTWAYLLTKA
jgi:hypothetical protein